MNSQTYIDTTIFTHNRRRGWEQYQHSSGLIIVTSQFEEALLVQRSRFTSYAGFWSIPGGYRNRDKSGLEPSLECAVAETFEEIGGLPEGKIRLNPHKIIKIFGKTYETFVLEINAEERKRFIPHVNDPYEINACEWHQIQGLTEKTKIHPGLKQFLREYKF
ncbi:MAG: NUDIX domain-containing protein [Candidatus Woesearchaeota archaeon]